MTARIFVSSTFADLQKYRTSVREVIQKLGAADVSMETLGARDERPLAECERLVRKGSDLFVGIYAHRYGFVPNGSAVSITEAEYRAATEQGLKRLIFIVDEDIAWPPKLVEQGEPREKLKRFLSELKANHICESFSDPNDLAARVASSVGRELSLKRLRRVRGESADVPSKTLRTPSSKAEWSAYRDGVYGATRGVFLAHTLRPTNKKGQYFDITIFLVRHKSAQPTEVPEVSLAEFFLGKFWGNKVIRVENTGDLVGISTSAYGSFLCTCKVHFTDGTSEMTYRYIDFESARAAR